MTPVQSQMTLQVNGEPVPVTAGLHDTLLTVLRERLQLTAAKRGCNQGVCGACTVRVDNRPVRACLTLAHACEDVRVTTLEGLDGTPLMHTLQHAFAQGGAFQCGFCTPGMLISAHWLLEQDRDPDDTAIRQALSGNLCRCTGYAKIIAAVRAAATVLREEAIGS